MTEPEIILVEEHTRPICTVVQVLRTGSLHDPEGLEGLGYITGQMLTRGAGRFDQAALAEEIDFLGAALSISVGRRTVTITGDVLTRHLDTFEGLLVDVLTTPTFDPDELEKLKRQTLSEILQVRDIDTLLGQRFFVRQLFAGHPYARPLKGTLASIGRITIEDVKAHYARCYRNDRVLVAACGDIEESRLQQFIERTTGSLPPGGLERIQTPPPPGPTGYNVLVVDKPERTQVPVMMGHLTINGNHPDYLPLSIANILFGGTFTARLSQEIREKRGWSYGAYSYLHADQHLGTFMMRFSPAVADTTPALELTDALYKTLYTEGVSDEEVSFAKRYLINSHPFTIDTPEKQVQERLAARLSDRPEGWLETFVARVADVSTVRVNEAIRAHLDPEHLQVVTVATAAELTPALKAWPRVTRLDQVDYRAE